MQYFIITPSGEEGPFDLLSMVRKIKNGALTPATIVRLDGQSNAVPAGQELGLKTLFEEETDAGGMDTGPVSIKQYDLAEVFRNGWHFVNMHQSAVIMTGLFLILALMGGVALANLPYIGVVFAFVFVYIIFAAYQYLMLKRTRGQAFYVTDLIPIMQHSLVSLILAGLVISVPVGIGLMLLLAPGLLILTLYLFVPLLIIEQRRSFWEAMEMSRKKVMSLGSHNIGVLFALIVANLLGAVLILFPLLITLPLTTYVLSEIYDEHFSRQ
jgi:hypothetical protein